MTIERTKRILAAILATASSAWAAPETIPIEETTVVAERGYSAPTATTSTRDDTPIRDVPQSIQVVPRAVLEDRQVIRMSEVVETVSGARTAAGYGGLPSALYFFRGFFTNRALRNGLNDFGYLTPRDVANVERVEVLKGPASVLYGFGDPGGILNTVTKRPLATVFADVSLAAGSFDFYRPTIDVSGPVTPGRALRFRLNGAYENAGSFRDFAESERAYFAPVLSWSIGEATELTVEAEYLNHDYVFDRVFIPEPEFFDLPIERSFSEPGFDANARAWSVRYDVTHRFGDAVDFRQAFAAHLARHDHTAIAPDVLGEDRRTLTRYYEEDDSSQDDFGLQNQVGWRFETAGVRHRAIGGVDLARFDFRYDFVFGSIDPIDIFDPVYGSQPFDIAPAGGQEYGTDTVGVFVQDSIELREDLRILVGLRHDWNQTTFRNRDTGETLNDVFNRDLSPRAGIVWNPWREGSLYFGWAESFNPQFFSRSRLGEAFEPETGEQFELGIKQEGFDARLSATAALFQITKENVLVTDPEDPNFSIATGEQRSRGAELDVAGEPVRGWHVIATYAYTDAEITEDATLPIGDGLVNSPRNAASLWTTFRFDDGSLRGLGVGGGFVYAGEREATLPNAAEIPSFVRGDLHASYEIGSWRAQLNVKNVANADIYESTSFFIVPEPPRTFLGKISYVF